MSNFLLATQVPAIPPTEASMRGRPSQRKAPAQTAWEELAAAAEQEEGGLQCCLSQGHVSVKQTSGKNSSGGTRVCINGCL